MTPTLHDFRKPPPLSPLVATRLEGWLRGVSQAGGRHWTRFAAVPATLEFVGTEIAPAETLLLRLSETSFRHRVGLGTANHHGLLVVSRSLMTTLLAALFNEPLDSPPPEHEFTPVEEGLVELILNQFFLSLLQENWTLPGNLNLKLGPREPPRSLSALRPDERLVQATFRAQLPFGDLDWLWFVPRNWLEHLAGAGGPGVAMTAGERAAVVRELPLLLSVLLGSTELSLLQLARLRPGDVLVLEQKVTEPLPVITGDRAKFLAWPAAAGSRQAIEIQSLVED